MIRRINYSLLRAICALVIGLVLVLSPEKAIAGMVTVVGVIFMLPSLVSIIGFFMQKDASLRRFPIEGMGSFLFGLWLVVMPSFFATILTLLLGFILTLAGVQQLASLWVARRWSHVSFGFYLMPTLIFVAGLFALFNPFDAQRLPLLIIGYSAMIYAVFELIKWYKFVRIRPSDSERADPQTTETTQMGRKKKFLADDDDIADAEIVE